jgi:hypothetical protein
VSQAYLRLILGSSAQLPLRFVSEMPKLATRIMLDFSSLLGPLFFMWVIQLLYPVSFSVYEIPSTHLILLANIYLAYKNI